VLVNHGLAPVEVADARREPSSPTDTFPETPSNRSGAFVTDREPLQPQPQPPANVVVVLLDSLNRHHLGAYGSGEFATPNLDALAARAVRFTNHHTGSLPCMPARHDILCGALDFLWKPWGSIEIWEDAITVPLRDAGVTTKLISDHPHLFEKGGENFHCDFSAWDYLRGHENDPWKTRTDPSWVGTPSFGAVYPTYTNSRTWLHDEADFPGPKTMAAAARWLDQNATGHERFFLFVDEFDPHEPFDTPDPYATMYDPDWEGPHLIWPPYGKEVLARGTLDARQARQVRAQYGAKLTMIDHWFGKVLEQFDRHALWDTTALIVCTDHGHYLGEHDYFGKPPVPVMETLGHIPLFVHVPGMPEGAPQAGTTVDALTTSVDLHATIAELFGVGGTARHRTHGNSMLPLLTGESESIRDALLTGIWGREVHLVDGTHNYCRAPEGANEPLTMFSNRWSTMPIPIPEQQALPLPDDRAVLSTMPGSNVPVIRQPWDASDRLPYWAWGGLGASHLWNVRDDPDESHDLLADGGTGSNVESQVAERLRSMLLDLEAPPEQLVRLGLR
jgi:arylsulfatase A-like enzyme